GRELERGQQAARLVLGRLSCWERLPQLGECRLPGPPPQGREQIAADLAVAGGLICEGIGRAGGNPVRSVSVISDKFLLLFIPRFPLSRE
ncbi:TPA: hypothetical protein ACE76D_002098, partial [Neisseria gonorrhoeae]